MPPEPPSTEADDGALGAQRIHWDAERPGGSVRALTIMLVLVACSKNADTDTGPSEELGRCAAFQENRVALFGDTHIHTYLSLDANTQGNRMTPAEAYRFARGERMGVHPHDAAGEPLRTVQLARPLDWAVVSDHAEFLGVVTVCTSPDVPGYDDPACVRYRDNPDATYVGLNILTALQPDAIQHPPICTVQGVDCDGAAQSAWALTAEAAEAAYDRTDACSFTSFVGYEWSAGPSTFNLHRNVIFRNEVVPERPASYFDKPYVEDLWAELRSSCIDAGTWCDVLTIPHNSNLSGGTIFSDLAKTGSPIDSEYATARAAMEPLVEVFQHKGSSECWTGSPAGDELCGFEYLPFNSLASAHLDAERVPEARDFVRDTLVRGLVLQQELGVNPYKYGMVASTDTHLGTPGQVSEVFFPGHGGAGQSNRDELPPGLTDVVYFNPGGLAVVWAQENSREGIFQAMRRKEAYGTSGPRITLRFFGGWDYDEGLCADDDFAGQGYAGGVPMGGDLPAGAGAPTFAISALRDPGAGDEPGTPLQVVQVVKGWVGAGGPEFAVYDVAGSRDNGASVDPATCDTAGEGDDSLCTVWTDPSFDPEVPAVYYVRALENPTCRWHTRMCVEASVDCEQPDTVTEGYEGCCDERFPDTIQERAWSSPIWYQPA